MFIFLNILLLILVVIYCNLIWTKDNNSVIVILFILFAINISIGINQKQNDDLKYFATKIIENNISIDNTYKKYVNEIKLDIETKKLREKIQKE